MNASQVKQNNIASLTNLLIKLNQQRELIDARGNIEEMILHERKINQTLRFLEVLTA